MVKRTVARYCKQALPRGNVARLESREINYINEKIKENCKLSVPKLTGQLTSDLGTEVSKSTVRRTVKSMNFQSCAASPRPPLTAEHKERRLKLATEWSRRSYKRIIFSDEAKFNVFNSDGRVRFWCNPEERHDGKNYTMSAKGNGRSAMVWGCIAYEGVGALTIVDGTLDSIGYTRILSTYLHDSASKLGLKDGFTFQQDHIRTMDSALVKRLCGSDVLTGRPLYSNQVVSYEEQTKFVVIANEMPTFTTMDAALWRRIEVVLFQQTFRPGDDNVCRGLGVLVCAREPRQRV